ncbi:hypothetical protein ACFP56_10415 [Paenibacillus septentrionalis]|uniref:DUF1514 domain-containing protein n=1 Tax=Paenibacillus septentrionalis TaxID=429342 RepID=A0ABW1V2L2_9BACL
MLWFIFMTLILITLLDISVTLRKQLQQSKDTETAIYRLIELTKEDMNNKW